MTTTTRRSETPYPTRIVCLTEETTEALYLLGEEGRIVGISGFTVRPPRARKEKPKVSAFISAKIDRILALEPDLVLGFSDLQADIASQLIRHGVEVHVFNQRSVDEILRVIRMLGGIVGCEDQGRRARCRAGEQDSIRCAPRRLRCRTVPVSTSKIGTPRSRASAGYRSSVRHAGGDDIFPELAACGLGKDRIVADARSRAARAGYHFRVVVRQEVLSTQRRGATRLARRPSRP